MPFQISITGTSSDIHRHYHEGIELHGEYEIALKTFTTFNNIPNISESNQNNRIRFILPEGKFLECEIPTGRYTLFEIDSFIQTYWPDSGWQTRLDKVTSKVKLYCGWGVDFSEENSIGRTLRFKEGSVLIGEQSYYSELPIQLYSINMIKIKCNLIRCNIEDFRRNEKTIHEFPLNTYKAAEQLIERPPKLSYYTVNTDIIHELSLRIVDQNDRLIHFGNEQIYISLKFRPKKQWKNI